MKVVRILVYEGPEEWVKFTLNRSVPDGKKALSPTGSPSLTAVTLGTMPDYINLLVSVKPAPEEQKAEEKNVKE